MTIVGKRLDIAWRDFAWRLWRHRNAVAVVALFCVISVSAVGQESGGGVLGWFGEAFRAPEKPEEGRGTNPIWVFVIVTITVAVLRAIVEAVRRDRIMRRHNKNYGVLLHDSSRYTGIVKLILQDVEIASEKTDVSGKDSGRLFTKANFQEKMKALVRYHDEFTEQEAEERRVFAERIYNPSLLGKFSRRVQSAARQMSEAVKTIYEEAIGKPLRTRLKQFQGGAQLSELADTGVEETSGVSVGGASYRLLIDRLIGTRVIALAEGREYECVLADYTTDYYQLLDVEFIEEWSENIRKDMGTWRSNDKGFRFAHDGDTIIIESRVSYPVTLRHVYYKGGHKIHDVHIADKERKDVNLKIEPYSAVRWKAQFNAGEERDVAGGNFQEVKYHLPFMPQNFDNVEFHFRTVRRGDVTLRYSDNVVQYRAEKFDARLVSLDSLSEALWRGSSRFVVTDENDKPIRGLHLNRGYITNLSQDRVDIREVTAHYSRRWEAERTLEQWDEALRPIRAAFKMRWGRVVYKAKLAAAQIALINYFKTEKRVVPPNQRVLYFPFVK
ncbi:MAG: hypothetical protein O3A46_12445, partial [Candidatus Poribacteria bacterium]|nr:hypothetical protein [Candidatus Poribacteria bacterium]